MQLEPTRAPFTSWIWQHQHLLSLSGLAKEHLLLQFQSTRPRRTRTLIIGCCGLANDFCPLIVPTISSPANYQGLSCQLCVKALFWDLSLSNQDHFRLAKNISALRVLSQPSQYS